VKLERDIRLQQIKIARMRQQRYGALDRPRDRAQLDQIARNRGTLVQKIKIARRALGVDRPRKRLVDAQIGNVALDALQLSLVPRQQHHL
jgi:hypothetical protein